MDVKLVLLFSPTAEKAREAFVRDALKARKPLSLARPPQRAIEVGRATIYNEVIELYSRSDLRVFHSFPLRVKFGVKGHWTLGV